MPIDNITKNRQKRLDRAKEEKDLIRLWRKKALLDSAKRKNIELIELPKPIRSGYTRKLVLREDVAKSDEAKVYLEVLPEIQNVQRSRNKEFTYKKDGKVLPMEHSPNPIAHKRWNELSYRPKIQAMFEMVWKPSLDYRGRPTKGGSFVYVFKKQWAFVSKMEPYYITHRIVLNPALESEVRELANRIERNGLWPKIAKACGFEGSWKDWEDERRKVLEKAMKKDFQQEFLLV